MTTTSKRGRPPGRDYPEMLRARVKAGWLATLSRLAADQGISQAELVRRQLQQVIDAAPATAETNDS